MIVRHFPSLPPTTPASRALLAILALVTAEQGARAAARLCREKSEAVALLRDRVSVLDPGLASDFDELVDWLKGRADELDPGSRDE